MQACKNNHKTRVQYSSITHESNKCKSVMFFVVLHVVLVDLPVCITENEKCTAAWYRFFSLLHADFR